MYLDTVLDGVVSIVITEHLDDSFVSDLISGEPECFPRWFDMNSSNDGRTLVWNEVQQVCFREVECVGFISDVNDEHSFMCKNRHKRYR